MAISFFKYSYSITLNYSAQTGLFNQDSNLRFISKSKHAYGHKSATFLYPNTKIKRAEVLAPTRL
jgi:hypothetical protein